MDDNPAAGDCKNNLQFTNDWGTDAGAYNFHVVSNVNSSDATHELGYGFQLSSGTACVFQGLASGVCLGGNYCPGTSPVGISGARTVTSVGQWSNSTDHSVLNFGGLYNDQNIGEFGFNFKIVECTADSQCTPGSGTANSDANSNTAKYIWHHLKYWNIGACRAVVKFLFQE